MPFKICLRSQPGTGHNMSSTNCEELFFYLIFHPQFKIYLFHIFIFIYSIACSMFALILMRQNVIKDGAYFCYCSCVLRISRYSGFLWVVPTNTGIFLRGFKLYGESRA